MMGPKMEISFEPGTPRRSRASVMSLSGAKPESTGGDWACTAFLNRECPSFRGKWDLFRVQVPRKSEHLVDESFPYPVRGFQRV
jgi:hypothetical protein